MFIGRERGRKKERKWRKKKKTTTHTLNFTFSHLSASNPTQTTATPTNQSGLRSVDKKGKEIHYDIENKINFSVFPGLQGGPHNHTIAGLACALHQAKGPEFIAYQKQVLANSKALSDGTILERERGKREKERRAAAAAAASAPLPAPLLPPIPPLFAGEPPALLLGQEADMQEEEKPNSGTPLRLGSGKRQRRRREKTHFGLSFLFKKRGGKKQA